MRRSGGRLGGAGLVRDEGMAAKTIIVYCADIGLVAKGNFGWARGVASGQALAV